MLSLKQYCLSVYPFLYAFLKTIGHNKMLAGIIINLNHIDVAAAPLSIFDTLKNENQMANKTPMRQ
ncbi:MAG: hypothetical protein ABIX01_07580 [Chitinophagaceae bacterium]